MLLQREDNDDDTILGKVLAVAENNVSDISNTESVNENTARLYMIDDVRSALTDQARLLWSITTFSFRDSEITASSFCAIL